MCCKQHRGKYQLFWCLLFFIFACRQAGNDGTEYVDSSHEIIITVKGDYGVTVNMPNFFKFKKSST